MADSSAATLAYRQEGVYSVVPSGKFKELRISNESLKLNTGTTVSQELTTSRQITDLIRTTLSAAGDINGEFSYGTYDDFFESTLMSAAWTTPVSVAGTTISFESISTSSSDYPKLKNSVGTGFDAINQSQWIKISGSSNTSNNVMAKVVNKVSGGDLDLVIMSESGDFTDEAAGASITAVQGAQVTNGSVFKSYTIERNQTDVSNTFDVYTGMAPNSLSFTSNKESIINLVVSMMGKIETGGTATVGDGANTAVNTNPVMQTIDNMQAVLEGGASYDVTEFSMSMTNDLRNRTYCGSLGPRSLGKGEFKCTGTISTYFENVVRYNKYRNFTVSSLGLGFIDNSGNAYVLDMPSVKYSDGTKNGEGLDTDVMEKLSFQAIRDDTEGITIRIVRFDAA